MGYTHYNYRKKELNYARWLDFIKDVQRLLKTADVELAYEYDSCEKKPQVDEDMVRFNGIFEDGHETFLIERIQSGDPVEEFGGSRIRPNNYFSFCKTARKPYDKYVTACLILAKIHFGDDIDISSDGNPEEWEEGKAEVEKLLDGKITIEAISDGEFKIICDLPKHATEEEFLADVKR